MANPIDDLLAPEEFASLLSPNGGAGTAAAGVDSLTLDDDPLAAAVPYQLESFDAEHVDSPSVEPKPQAADRLVRIELGRCELTESEAADVRAGSVIALDALANDPVDILVDGRRIARGEVLVLEDKLCVRIAEVLLRDEAPEATTGPDVSDR